MIQDFERLTKLSSDCTSTAMVWIRPDASFAYVNEAAAQRLGYERRQLLSMGFTNIAEAYPIDAWKTFLCRLQSEGNATVETELLHKNGTPIAVEIRTDLVKDEGHEVVFAIIVDITERKQAEESLRRAESIRRSIMESSLDSIMLVDPEEKIQFINRTAPGLTPEQVINTSVFDYLAEQDHARIRHCLQRVLRTGEPGKYQVNYHQPDTQVTTWEARVAPVWTNDRVTGLTMIARDETESIRAQQALRVSERSLAKAQEIAHIGSWEFDLTTGQATGSAELFRILGLSESQTLPSVESFISKSVHPEDREMIATTFKNALENGKVAAVEFRVIRQPDHLCYVRAEAEFVDGEDGVPRKIIGTIQEMTEQKRVELALRESEAKFRVLTERSPAIVFIARAERIVYCNSMLEEVTGYSNDELLRMNFMTVLHADCRELVADRHRARLGGHDPPQRYEVKIIRKNGEHRWVDLSAQLVDFEGQPAVLVTCADVTDRKHTEEKLRDMESQLAHVSRLSTMGEMVAGIAHEINQPLSAVANYSQACRNTVNTTDHEFDVPIEEWLRTISDQAIRCGDIIRRLRNFVKKNVGERECVDLNCVVRDAVALIGSDLQNKHVNIDCQLPSPGPQVNANEVQLQQVLVNLLQNACDATRGQKSPQVKVRVSPHESSARLVVEDNGGGVEVSKRPKIFDAFFTTKPDGMGMGLAISKSIVEAHWGSLRLDPDATTGAAFHVELPITETMVVDKEVA